MRTSVVIETWNATEDGPEALARSLRALAAQDRAPEEVILVDGGSSPSEALRAVAAREAPLASWLHAPGAGYYEQKNAGAAVASGEVIAFVDSDVTVGAGWLRTLAAFVEETGEDVVTGGTCYAEAPLARLFTLSVFAEYLVERPTPVHSFVANNCAFRASAWRAAGGFPSGYGRRGGCTRLASRLANMGLRILCVPGALAVHDFELDVHHLTSLQLQFGYATWKTRRDEPTLPGARAARLGPLGPLLLTGGRVVRDLGRLGRVRALLEIPRALVPAYGAGLIAARAVGMVGMFGGMLRPEYMARTLGW